MTVKADSKGRLTGARPETRYLKRTDPDGTITYVPEVPMNFNVRKEISAAQFEEFFGVPVNLVPVDGIQVYKLAGKDDSVYPYGIHVSWFATDGKGHRVYPLGENGAVKGGTLITIRKEDS